MIALLLYFRPHLFGSLSLLDAGVRVVQVFADSYGIYIRNPENKEPSEVVGYILLVLSFVPVIVAFIFFLNRELTMQQRLRIINNSLFIELNQEKLREKGINPKDFEEVDLNDNEKLLQDLETQDKKVDDTDDGAGDENDLTKPLLVKVRPPPETIPIVRPPAVHSSDESCSLDDIEEVEMPPAKDVTDPSALFMDKFLRFPTTPPIVHRKVPVPELPRVHPASDVMSREVDQVRGYSKLDRVRQILTIANSLNFAFKDTLNTDPNKLVAYDARLIDRFRRSNEADKLKKENDSMAKDVGYLCFGVIFFFGAFVWDYACSMLFLDPWDVRFYPQSLDNV
jgi:hypothetical protein